MTNDAITEARRLLDTWYGVTNTHEEFLARAQTDLAALLSATGAAEARGTEQVNVPDDGRLSKLCEREHWYRRGCPGLDDGSDYAISGDMAIDVADDLSAAIDLIEDERLAHQETRGAVAAWKQEGEKLRARVTALEQELTATGAILDECEARIMAESARATAAEEQAKKAIAERNAAMDEWKQDAAEWDALITERDALQAQLTAARADLQTLARGFLAFRGLAVLNESADPAVLNTWLPGIDAATRIAEDAALPPTPEET